MVETPRPHGEHGDGSTVDGAAVVDRYWPYDGPHTPETAAAAAEAIADLVRYVNNATGPGNVTHTLPHASHVYGVLGSLDTAIGGLWQLAGNLLWASVNHAADPTLYDDRRDRPALDTAGKLDTALDRLREQFATVAATVDAARAHSAHLGHDVPTAGGEW